MKPFIITGLLTVLIILIFQYLRFSNCVKEVNSNCANDHQCLSNCTIGDPVINSDSTWSYKIKTFPFSTTIIKR